MVVGNQTGAIRAAQGASAVGPQWKPLLPLDAGCGAGDAPQDRSTGEWDDQYQRRGDESSHPGSLHRQAEFLSISRILLQAPAQYARSFLYTESDDNDLTYFLLYQLGVLRRATDELRDYLARKMAAVRDAETLIKASAALNHRQLALLSRAVRVADTRFTVASHRLSHRVSYETARTGLLHLERKGLLTRRRLGHAYYFAPHPELETRLRNLQ